MFSVFKNVINTTFDREVRNINDKLGAKVLITEDSEMTDNVLIKTGLIQNMTLVKKLYALYVISHKPRVINRSALQGASSLI